MSIDELRERVKDGFKIKEFDIVGRKLVLVGNEQIAAGRDDLIKASLTDEAEVLDEFVKSPFYTRSLLKIHQRGIVLIDLADFSKMSNDEQVRLITRFQFYVRHLVQGHGPMVESVLSTGDGYFIIFREDGFRAMLRFVMRLIKQLTFYNFEDVGANKFYFRIAINVGQVHFFYDINDRWNYVGDGINDAKRIIDFIPHQKENAVYLSKQVHDYHKDEGFNFGPIQVGYDKHRKAHSFVEVFYQKI